MAVDRRISRSVAVCLSSARSWTSKYEEFLKTSDSPRYTRMIASFAYSALDAAISSAWLRRGVGAKIALTRLDVKTDRRAERKLVPWSDREVGTVPISRFRHRA